MWTTHWIAIPFYGSRMNNKQEYANDMRRRHGSFDTLSSSHFFATSSSTLWFGFRITNATRA